MDAKEKNALAVLAYARKNFQIRLNNGEVVSVTCPGPLLRVTDIERAKALERAGLLRLIPVFEEDEAGIDTSSQNFRDLPRSNPRIGGRI
ncbi:MAG: hypothetical protein HZA19_00430 [Nitrospirae bacterium]|nr:hypothetical protein [Nitrospirota bacterium]